MKYKKFFVRWHTYAVDVYGTAKEATEAILEAFTRSGEKPVNAVWSEDARGAEYQLLVEWDIKLKEAGHGKK